MKASLATALLVGATLSSLLFSTAPAFAESKGKGEGNTPVTFCHNGHLITTDDDGELNGHRTKKGIHVHDVFAEDRTSPLNAGVCLAALAPVTPEPSAVPSEAPTKGITPASPVVIPPHSEPNLSGASEPTEQAYPAPVVTPNTVNGVVPDSANPTPAPVAPTATATDRLADTGANDLLYIWGAVGLLALLAGLASVIYVRTKAA